VVVTNGDNDYHPTFLAELVAHADYDMVTFDYYSRFQNPSGGGPVLLLQPPPEPIRWGASASATAASRTHQVGGQCFCYSRLQNQRLGGSVHADGPLCVYGHTAPRLVTLHDALSPPHAQPRNHPPAGPQACPATALPPPNTRPSASPTWPRGATRTWQPMHTTGSDGCLKACSELPAHAGQLQAMPHPQAPCACARLQCRPMPCARCAAAGMACCPEAAARGMTA
jgi:hypothetical protein